MLVWVKDITVTWADLLHASISWENAEDAFLVTDTQKSDRSCLLLNPTNSFMPSPDGSPPLEFRYNQEDAARNLRVFVTTFLGSLWCCTDVQVEDIKGMLLKYVTSYITKMHEA